ncbi:MAG: extracellular solute-binding protein [Bacilli bacterium]|nr:extracellular solute-binding protein [Bacilli bacterium]
MKKFILLLLVLMFSLTLVSCDKDDRTVVRFGIISGQISTAVKNLQFEEKFELANPDINIDVIAMEGNYDGLRAATIMDINSGSASTPDLVIGYPDHFAEYYGGGALVNLQTFIDSEEGYTQAELNDFLAPYLNENRGFSSANPNDLYGLPFNKSSEVMIYNKTAFEVLFGEDWEDKIPATWEELKAVSQEIIDLVEDKALDKEWIVTAATDTKPAEYLIVSDYLKQGKFAPFGYDSNANGFITLTRQWGGKYTERDSVAKGYAVFNNPENPEAKQMMKDVEEMHDDGYFNLAANFGSSYCSDALKAIQCLMTVGSTAGVRYNESDEYEYELGVAPIPYKEADKKFVIQQGTNIAMLDVNSTEEEKLAAWKFLKFLLTPENTAAFAMETGGYFPVRKSAFESEAYQAYLTNPPEEKAAYSLAANVAQDFYITEYQYFVDPAFIGSSLIRLEVGTIFDDVIVNGEDVDERFAESDRTLKSYLRKE